MAPATSISVAFVLTALLSVAKAYNFAIAESYTVIDHAGGVSETQDLLFISDGSESPGCCQWEKSQSLSGFPIPDNYFNAYACGVNLGFYPTGGDYVYYKNNGDGTELGRCTSNNAPSGQVTASCLGFGSVNTIYIQYSCTNYNQDVNGVNPCTPAQPLNTNCS
ncbi:hypothetical protein V8C44DRAFT_369057 [Trichoderma aethiopicum]